MKNIITYENLHYFAYSNDKLCRGKVKGIVLDFFGLGAQLMYDDHPWGRELALQNIRKKQADTIRLKRMKIAVRIIPRSLLRGILYTIIALP